MSEENQSKWYELQKVHDRLYSLLSDIRYERSNKKQNLGVMYFYQSLQISGAMLELSRSKFQHPAIALSRQLLEAVVRFNYLAFGPDDAYERLDFQDIVQTLKALKTLPGNSHKSEIKLRIAELEVRKKQYVPAKFSEKLSFLKMLEALKSENHYPFFRLQSSVTHSEIFGLSHQFFRKNQFGVELFFPEHLQEKFLLIVNDYAAANLGLVEASAAKLQLFSEKHNRD